jgi:hypothetical protein
LREGRPVEHLCVRAVDPSLAIDWIEIVDNMPEELRAVFLRRCQSKLVGWDLNGQVRVAPSVGEIASELGISVPTVKRRWAEAKKFLQQRFPELPINRKSKPGFFNHP